MTFPAGWTVQAGALTGFDTTVFALPPTVTGNAAARTVTFTIDGIQTSLAILNIPINATAELVNPGAPAAGLTVTVDATGQAQGTSAAFDIVAAAATAAITGTIQAGNNTEGHIVAGGGTIIITLTNDTWVADDGTFAAQRQNIINGISSAQAEGTGWNAVVRAGLVVGNVVRTSATVVTVTLPAFATYNITANETVTVTVPGTAVTGGNPIVAAPTFNILAASAAITGTIQAGANTEAAIVAGGGTIIITLTNDTWVPDDGTFAAQRQNIINGITSAQAEGTGWNTTVRDTLAVGTVVRTSATVVTVTLPAIAGYDITADETITVTVPATAIASAGALTAAPTLTIVAALPVSAAITGTIQAGANTEAAIVADGGTIIITLTNDTWVAAGGVFDGQRQNIINGITSAGAEGAGWNAVVQAGLAVGTVVRTSGTVVTVTLPAFAGYNITANETITVTVPATAVTGAALIVAAPTFTITFTAPPAPPIFAPAPTLCPVGTFSATGFTPCQPAPPGSYVNVIGGTSATPCAPGTYNNTSGSASCVDAPVNFFVAVAGATTATACPTGTTTNAPGATSESQCVRPNQVSSVSFTANNYRAGALAIWTLEFTTSATGALTSGNRIYLTVTGYNFFAFGSQTGAPALGGDFVVGGSALRSYQEIHRIAPDTIEFVLRDASLDASQTGRLTLVIPNPTARTIASAAITVRTTRDTTPGAALADVVITPPPGPKLTSLLVGPEDFTSLAQLINVPLVDGQTAYTVDVPAGKRYFVAAEAERGDLTYLRGTTPYEPNVTPLATGTVVTVRAADANGSTDYTVTLRGVLPTVRDVFYTVTSPAPTANTNLNVRFTLDQPLPAGGRIMVRLPADFALSTVPLASFVAGSGTTTVAQTGLTSNVVIVTTGTAALPAGTPITLRFPVTNPAAKTILKAGMTVHISHADLGTSLPVASSADIVISGTAVRHVSITSSSLTPGAATTMTVRFTPTTELLGNETIRVKLAGYTFTGAFVATAGRGITRLTSGMAGSVAADATDTVVISLSPDQSVNGGTEASFTFPATNPSARTIPADGLTVATSRDTIPVASSAGITFGSAVTVTAVTPASGPGGVFGTSTVVTIAGTGFGTSTAGITSVTVGGFAAPSVTWVSSTIIQATVPPRSVTGAFPVVVTVGGVASNSDVTYTYTGALLNPIITLSNTTASATAVTATVSFSTPVAIPAGGRIVVEMPGFTWPGTPTATFTSPSALANSAAFTAGTLTVTLNAGVSVSPQSVVTFTVTGATNPAAQPARTNVVMRTTTSADQVRAQTSTGTLVAIPGTSVTALTISASPLVASAATTITTTFRATTALVAADTITVKMTGYTFPEGSVAVAAGTGITGTLTGTVTADARDTVVIRGGAVVAGTSARLTFLATNPGAGTIATSALTVHTSKDTTPVDSSAGFTLTAAGPRVTAVTPAFGPSGTGTVVSITGSGFGTSTASITSVTVGGFAAPSVTWLSSTIIQAIVPARIVTGALPVVVTVGGVASNSDVTYTYTGALLNAAVTLSSTVPSATAVTATVAFVTPVAIPSGGKIVVEMPGFTWPAAPTATFTSSSALANSAAFTAGTLTVTLNAGVPADSAVTFTVTGATNPAAQPARTNVVMRTTTSADVVVAQTSTGTMPAIATAVNRLVIDAPSFASVGVAFAQQPTVRVVNASGATVGAATDTVTLTKVSGSGSLTCTSTSVAAVAGAATFAGCRISAADTYTLTASATGITSASHTITVQRAVTATKLTITSVVPTTLRVGEKFTLTVAAQDATGATNPNQMGSVTLASSTPSAFKGLLEAPFVSGVATFSGLSFSTASAAGYEITAGHGALTSARSPSIPVTADNVATQLVFTQQPAHEASGVAFTTQPRLEFRNAANQVVTSVTSPVTLSLSKSGDTTTSLITTATSTTAAGVATFAGVNVTGADANLVLNATAAVGGVQLTATSGPFTVHATEAAATTLRLNRDLSVLSSESLRRDLQTTLKNEISMSLRVSSTRITVASITAGITQEIASGVATGQAAQVNEAGEPVISFGAVDIDAFAEANPAPAGTSLLFGFAFIGRDSAGLDLATAPGSMAFDFTLPAGRVLAGTPSGDLQFVRWTGTEWVLVPTQVTANEDGSYDVSASTTSFDVIALMFAPGLGAITGFNGYSSAGHALAVFGGGPANLLARAAELRGATGVWLQRFDGLFRVLRVNGPAFLLDQFLGDFGLELAANTPVTLAQARPATVSTGTPPPAAASSGTTHTVAPGETLSAIGVRYGIPWMSIAEANGIAGPSYAIRDGLVLTIPQ
ncbi:MAG: IPT/TIG domain-containing protein [Chloroflexi bacterium]|nr:IPT/TIG domain-containing protein [Chloroflexota bacterium]